MRDWWCPNCGQMVSPKISANAALVLVVFVFILWTGYNSWTSPEYFTILVVEAGKAALIAGGITAIWPERSCPICKTTKLDKEAPGSAA